MKVDLPEEDARSIRVGLAALPRADHHKPGVVVNPRELLVVSGHRAALDPDRALVVGNRGMGKSFWAHALADATARGKAAESFRELAAIDVLIGFNASDRADGIAPTPSTLRDAFEQWKDPDALWRAVLVRAASHDQTQADASLPEGFSETVGWAKSNPELVDRKLTALDDRFVMRNRKLVIVFDALDRPARRRLEDLAQTDVGAASACACRPIVSSTSPQTLHAPRSIRRPGSFRVSRRLEDSQYPRRADMDEQRPLCTLVRAP